MISRISEQPHRNKALELERAIDTVRNQTGASTYEAAWAEGQVMTVEQALQEALKIAALAEDSLKY